MAIMVVAGCSAPSIVASRMTGRYQRGVASVLQRSGRVMGVFAALVAALLLGLHWLPGVPAGRGPGLFHDLDPAAGRSHRRAHAGGGRSLRTACGLAPGHRLHQSILGYSFSGSGPSAALTYTMLKDWGERAGATAAGEVAAAQKAMGRRGRGDERDAAGHRQPGRSSGFSAAGAAGRARPSCARPCSSC
jgi:multidrug efflux pump